MSEIIYSSIGKFIVEYERVQAILKSIIGQNSIIHQPLIGSGKDLNASKVIRRAKKYLEDKNHLDIEKHKEGFKLLINRINELNNFRNEILHGLLTPSLTENNKLAMIFSHHRLYEDDSLNITSSKISLLQLNTLGSNAHQLYVELLKILSNKIINPGDCIFKDVNFNIIKQSDFNVEPRGASINL